MFQIPCPSSTGAKHFTPGMKLIGLIVLEKMFKYLTIEILDVRDHFDISDLNYKTAPSVIHHGGDVYQV